MAGSGWLAGYRAFWVYTIARFALFAVIAGVLWAVGVPLLLAALIAAVVSFALSWFLLAKPREAFAATIEQRVSQRRDRSADLGARLEGAAADDDPDAQLPPGVTERSAVAETSVTEVSTRNRAKRR